MKNVFLALFVFVIGVSNAQVSKIVEGYLDDYKTKRDAEKVDITLKSLKSEKFSKKEQMKMEDSFSKMYQLVNVS